jgi:transcriptional regulator with XRE-family HTH domain
MADYRMCLACRLRLRYGISQKEIAKAAGVTRQLISLIELEKENQTKGHEVMLRRAFAGIIAARRQQMDALEHDLAVTSWLFSPSEEDD